MKKKVIITTKDGKVSLDIPGDGPRCQPELDDLLNCIENFIPEEKVTRTPREKQELEVNVT